LCRLAERRGRVFQLAHYAMFRLLAALGSDFGIPFVLCLGCRVRRDGKAPGLV